MTSTPARINQDLYDAAQKMGAAEMRSTAEQINYLVRVGLEVEQSHAASTARRAAARLGDLPYDSLNATEQAIVRATWDAALEADSGGIDLREVLAATGAQFLVEADEDGQTAVTSNRAAS